MLLRMRAWQLLALSLSSVCLSDALEQRRFTADSDISSSFTPRWEVIAEQPKLPKPYKEARLESNGASIWYAQWHSQQKGSLRKAAASKPPLVFLHGGLASTSWFGHQIDALRTQRNIIAVDSRGQGRSTSNGTISYTLMTDDVLNVLDHLKVDKADFVGWSDGGIMGLDLLLRAPERISRVFSFAPNYSPAGAVDLSNSTDPLPAAMIARQRHIYEAINPNANWTRVLEEITTMWASTPNWSRSDFKAVPAKYGRRFWVVDGDHDANIVRSQIDDLAKWIKDSSELLLPAASHYAHIQSPNLFTDAIIDWLNVEV